MKLSIVIPARNEEKALNTTIPEIHSVMARQAIDHEIIVVNDGSQDRTEDVLKALRERITALKYINNPPPNGYGLAVRKGLAEAKGDAVCVMMGDGSDSPRDIILYYNKLKEGFDCVFGSRFIKGSRLVDYPFHKLILNRLGNYFIKVFLGVNHNDITNAFKCYRREVIEGVQPLFSNHFNLTVELPLKAVIRGYNFATVPISWTNRAHGMSKFKIKEIGSRYMFIILYIFLEKTLSRGDYLRRR